MPFPDETEFVLPGGITLNSARDSDGVLYTCATVQGWGSPGTKSSGSSREGEHGDAPAPNPKLKARFLQVTGRIEAPTRLLRERAEHRLNAALSLQLFDMTVVGAIPLRVRAERQGDIDMTDDTDLKTVWQADLKCPDPRRYGEQRELTLAMPSVSGGVRFPLRFPLRFTGSTSFGDGEAVNEGNMPAPVKVTFTGPAPAPTLVNVTTGQSVTYNDTLGVGEFVVIYLRNPLVAMLQGTAGRSGKVSTSGGGTFGIKDGPANTLAYRAAGGSGTALVEWSDTYQ